MTHPISKVGRRQFLAGAGALATVGTFGIETLQSSPVPMRAIAASKGLLFGTALRDTTIRNPISADLVATQCSIVVSEGALKWDTLRPGPKQFDFRSADEYLNFSQTNNLLARGHNLVWHEALPKWFGTTVNSGNARSILLDHISTVVGRYAGKIHSWDVVNEIVENKDGRPDGLRNTPWLRLIGPDYIEAAFHAARDADSHALLVYNEDQLESDNYRAQAKRQRVLELLKNLRRRGTPIDALGIESHIPAEGFVASPTFGRFLQEISDLGMSIFITEMDVSDERMVGDISARDSLVAGVYYDYLAFVLKFTRVAAVLTWGLSDRYSWLATQRPRADGLPVRPLPFDGDLRPTPAWQAIRNAIEGAPKR